MPDTPHNPSNSLPEQPGALRRLGGDEAFRFHDSDAHGNAPDDTVPDTDSADTQCPKPIDYAKQLARIAEAVLAGIIPPNQAQAAARSLRSSYDVLYASSRVRDTSSSARTASPDPTGAVTPGTRTASDDQMRTIIDVFLDRAPDHFHAIAPMLTEADHGYVQTRFTSTSTQEPS